MLSIQIMWVDSTNGSQQNLSGAGQMVPHCCRIHSQEITMKAISRVPQLKGLNMKVLYSKQTVPKVHMGSGYTPPRIAKVLPKVRMGSGFTPPRIAKELPKVRMGSGFTPPRIAKEL